jgi:hypothetical protein
MPTDGHFEHENWKMSVKDHEKCPHMSWTKALICAIVISERFCGVSVILERNAQD